MPRLTTKHYLAAHLCLRRWWLEDRRTYACLTPNEQWDLHDFFRPSRELIEEDLFAHRQAVSRERPSLPQQAGKALAKFEREAEPFLAELQELRHAPPRAKKPAETPVQLQGIVNPNRDFSRVVIAMAEYLARQHPDDHAA